MRGAKDYRHPHFLLFGCHCVSSKGIRNAHGSYTLKRVIICIFTWKNSYLPWACVYNIVKVVGVIVDIGVVTIEITIYILQQFPKNC